MGLFSADPFEDARLGTFVRKGGAWLGRLDLPPHGTVGLRIAGDRRAPAPLGLALAAALPAEYATLQAQVAGALFEHLTPYRDAVRSGEYDDAPPGLLEIQEPAGVWTQVREAMVDVDPDRGEFPVEVRLGVSWDEEHTLGVRLKAGTFVELCGSVGPL